MPRAVAASGSAAAVHASVLPLETSVEAAAGSLLPAGSRSQEQQRHDLRQHSSYGGVESATVVYATPLADRPVLMAVPVAAAGSLSVQAGQEQSDAGRQGGTRAGGPAAAGSRRNSTRQHAASATPSTRRLCQHGTRNGCTREGARICQRCRRWLCSEHLGGLDGAACCKACATRDDNRPNGQQFECLENRCQSLLCACVCVGLFVLFYLGPYRDGRK